MDAIFGWLSEASTFASRLNRASLSASRAKSSGRTFDPRRAHWRQRARTTRSRMGFSEIDAGGVGTPSQPSEHLARRVGRARALARNARRSKDDRYIDPSTETIRWTRPNDTQRYRSASRSGFLPCRVDLAPNRSSRPISCSTPSKVPRRQNRTYVQSRGTPPTPRPRPNYPEHWKAWSFVASQ